MALQTDLWHRISWAPFGRAHEEKSFSSVGLGGDGISRSVVSRRERPDLRPSVEALEHNGAVLVNVTEHSRDIDGCTVIVHWRTDNTPSWEEVAALADGCVDALDAAAVSMRNERAEGGCAPVLDVKEARVRPSALWAHTVLVCGQQDLGHRCGNEAAAELLPSSFELVRSKDASSFLALHASLVCANTAELGYRAVELMDELHGWWSASWCLDQTLLATEAVLAERLSSPDMPELGPTADLLAVITTRVGLIRSRIDTLRLGLGGFEWPVWESAGRRWALEENLSSLERKRENLSSMTAAFRQALESHHAERLNQLAGFFAIVSSVASFVAVLLFLFPSLQDSTGLPLRSVLLVLVLGTTLAAVFRSSEYVLRASRRGQAA